MSSVGRTLVVSHCVWADADVFLGVLAVVLNARVCCNQLSILFVKEIKAFLELLLDESSSLM